MLRLDRLLVLPGGLRLDGLLLVLTDLLGLALLGCHEGLRLGLVLHLVLIAGLSSEQETAFLASSEEHDHGPGKRRDKQEP